MTLKKIYTAEELVKLTGFRRSVIDKWFTETGRWYDKGPVVKSTLTQGEVVSLLARGTSNRRNIKAITFLAELRGELAPGVDGAEMNKAIARLNSENEDEDDDIEVADEEIEAQEEGEGHDAPPTKHRKEKFTTAAVTKMLTICKKCRRLNSNGYQYCTACHKAHRSGNRTARAKMTA
jgi:hypothetical protein